jgi:hypothetical protein
MVQAHTTRLQPSQPKRPVLVHALVDTDDVEIVEPVDYTINQGADIATSIDTPVTVTLAAPLEHKVKTGQWLACLNPTTKVQVGMFKVAADAEATSSTIDVYPRGIGTDDIPDGSVFSFPAILEFMNAQERSQSKDSEEIDHYNTSDQITLSTTRTREFSISGYKSEFSTWYRQTEDDAEDSYYRVTSFLPKENSRSLKGASVTYWGTLGENSESDSKGSATTTSYSLQVVNRERIAEQ